MHFTTVSSSPGSLRNARHGVRAFAPFARMLGILAALVIGTGACLAGGGGVVDNGAFFSEQVKSDATKMIAEMERTLRKDLAIETFREIPASVKEGVNMQDKAAVGHMFQQWALKQAKQKGVNGVYVLLNKEPAHLEIGVGSDTQKVAFTLKDRDALVTLMLAKLRAHQNDDALRDGVNFVSATMKSHTAGHARTGTAPVPVTSHPAQSSGSSSGWILKAVIVGLVVWLIIGVVRAIFGRMGGGATAGQMGGGGGGGFMSSLVGGMFGAAAGMWMYDQFFSNHGSNSAYGADRNDASGGDSGFSGQDSDYNTSGGDFGGSDSGSSGGDSGGGGDFGGGGDSGGGGDF